MTAAAAHLLDQRGEIHIGDRVAEYIPEYARHGKEGITIAHVLSHKGGVPNLPPHAFDLANTGAPLLPLLSNLLQRALGVSVADAARLANEPEFLTATIPAGNVVTTANELSRFFELLRCGGELDGVRVFEPRTLRRALTEHSYMEIDYTLGFPTRFSLGPMLGARVLSIFGPDTELAFGHLGFTSRAPACPR